MYLNDERKVRKETTESMHNMILENRKKLTVSGVNEVESFNEDKIVLLTAEGKLTVTGRGMHIQKLHVETGDVLIFGQIDALVYMTNAEREEKGGFFAKLLK